MIKNLNENAESIDYFGGADIPSYNSLKLDPNKDPYEILSESLLLNDLRNVSGFIKNNNFYYYKIGKDFSYIDLSRKDVIIFVWRMNINKIFQQHMIFNFISSPCDTLRVMTKEGHIKLEKTSNTYKVCDKIDKLFDDITLYRVFMDMVISNNRNNTINDLISIMNAFDISKPFKNFFDWEYSYELILQKFFNIKLTKKSNQ